MGGVKMGLKEVKQQNLDGHRASPSTDALVTGLSNHDKAKVF